MTINKRYLKTNEGIVSTPTYIQFTTGTAFTTLYGGSVSGGNILASDLFYSNEILTDSGLINSVTFKKAIDKDFDVLFNQTIELRGEAIISIPVILYHTAGAGSPPTSAAYIKARVRKWDGTTETEIANGDSKEWSVTNNQNFWNYKVHSARVNIPATVFRAGEYLRLTIEVWAKEGQVNNSRVLIAHDPQNRTESDGEANILVLTSGGSLFKADIPFKMDL